MMKSAQYWLCAVAVAALWNVSARADDTLRLAAIDPLSGPAATTGEVGLKTWQFLASEVTHRGGLNGAISTFTTLVPGDVIVTGTPTGAGARFDPPRYLKPGDVIEIEAEGVGLLRNGVIDETTRSTQPTNKNIKTSMTGGEAIVSGLVAHGIETVFGLPGVQIYGLFDAFHQAQLKVIAVCDPASVHARPARCPARVLLVNEPGSLCQFPANRSGLCRLSHPACPTFTITKRRQT
jgi:Fumarylacetoacetate (FAA) hydrolase family/Thiamine pyrophosphate enzyme, N-terminal TPP binding domain